MGSPAPAGMDPARSTRRRRGFGLPRTRGDGPLRGANLGGSNLAPPHPRGWTLGPRNVRAVHAGSPPPAGMDRTQPARTAYLVALPRPPRAEPTTAEVPQPPPTA